MIFPIFVIFARMQASGREMSLLQLDSFSIKMLLVVKFRSLDQNNLAALFYGLWLIHCSHVTYLTYLETAYKSSKFVC